jgi:F0F1-type ATP synthase membrane subunit b/b'
LTRAAPEDAKAEAERILEQARQQAKQILDDARTRAQGS